ncbi:MAG: HNH endonuclease family protein [Actinomycetaceae bacterium]|nr:HNH endonuclease family protein [Actinomycetaceae bacterium]
MDRWVIAIILGLVVFALAPPPGLDLLGIGQRFNGKLPPWLGGPSPSTMETLPPSELATMLRELPVRTHSARDEGAPDYDRQAFGQRWADEDHNGCDTRNDILARDLSRPAFRENSKCVVVGGSLAEPYTGSVVEFQRGEKTSELVQIDHVVSLSDAWWSGAWTWDAPTRQRFANDPANLLAVDGKTNEDKGAASADRWLPPNRDFHCEYVSTQIRVKHAWALSVSEAEREAMAQVLSTCPLPQSGGEQ